jgi:hypothetical protein
MWASTSPGEDLGDGPDAHDRVAIRGWTAGTWALTEARHSCIAVAHCPDDDGRHLGVDKEDLPGETDHLVEQGIGTRNRHSEQESNAESSSRLQCPIGNRHGSHAALVGVAAR